MLDKVAILLATYNGAEFLRTQLDSVLNQTYTNWELLISDDGSTDDTKKIISEYVQKFPKKIKLIEKDEPTGNAKRNFMFLTNFACEYPYIMYCDQDDYWLPEKVELTLKKMKEIEVDSKIPCLVHSDLEVVDGELGLINPSFFEFSNLNYKLDKLNNFLIQNIVTGCTMMINNALLNMAMKSVDVEQILMHDWYFALIASAFGNIGFIETPLIKYRQHGNNSVGAKNSNDTAYILSTLTKKASFEKTIEYTMNQADMFKNIFNNQLTSSQKKLLTEYSLLLNSGMFNRILTFFKLKTWKYGFVKKIGQILYC